MWSLIWHVIIIIWPSWNVMTLSDIMTQYQVMSSGSQNIILTGHNNSVVLSHFKGPRVYTITVRRLNPFRTKFICESIMIYLYFLSFFNAEVSQVTETRSQGRREYPNCRVNIMADDGLATWGARASSAMIMTYFLRYIPASAPEKG